MENSSMVSEKLSAPASHMTMGRFSVRNFMPLILVFLLIYNISFIAAPSVSTGRIAIVLLIAVLGKHAYSACLEYVQRNSIFIIIFGLIFLYAILLYFLCGRVDSTQISRMFHFMAYSLFGAVLVSRLVDYQPEYFHRAYFFASLLQGLLIIYSFFSPDFREWISGLLVQSGNIELTFALQAPGFSNSSGANLSLIQGLGIFSALSLSSTSPSFKHRAGYNLGAVLIFVSTMLSGRTGLVVAVVIFAAFLLTAPAKLLSSYLFASLVAVVATYLFWERLMLQFPDVADQIDYLGSWAFEFFIYGLKGNLGQEFSSMQIPRLSLETFLGTGLVALDGYNAAGHDSGYIHTYYSMGLVFCVLFYLCLAKLYVFQVQKNNILLYLLILIMFIVELKEPFIFKYVFPFYIQSILLCSYKKDQESRCCHD